MKLIFLDIDGVLVTRRPGVMEERLLHNLQGLVQRTGAEIVLSSDWRRHPMAREEARRVLATVGLKIIGYTPCMSAFLAQRPTEILQWKKEFSKLPNREPLTNWIAIDDRMLVEERHGQYLRGHFVQTHPLRGLTEDRVEECVRLLSQDPPPQLAIGDEEAVLADPMSPAPGGRGAGGRSSSTVGARGRPRGGLTAPAAVCNTNGTNGLLFNGGSTPPNRRVPLTSGGHNGWKAGSAGDPAGAAAPAAAAPQGSRMRSNSAPRTAGAVGAAATPARGRR